MAAHNGPTEGERIEAASPKKRSTHRSSSQAYQHLATLARLTVLLTQRQEQIRRLTARITEIRRVRMMAVDGEASYVQSLTTLLDQATQVFQALPAQADADVSEPLEQAELLLNASDWDLTDFIEQQLEEKRNQQLEMIAKAKEDLERMRQWVEEMRQDLEWASRVKAPVRVWRARLLQRNEMLRQADRALREENFGALVETVNALRELPDVLAKMRAELASKIEQATLFSRHADLLLMKFPLDARNRYQYDVLLRTPSLPGTPGINVQDSSTLVKQDRELMDSVIDQITRAIDRASRRKSRGVTEADDNGDPQEANEDRVEENGVGRRLRAATRAWLYEPSVEEDPALEPPTDLNYLVREMGNLMYRLFMPEQMQQYLRDTECSITITTNDLELPWEFMYCEHCYEEREPDGDEPNLEEELRADEARYLCLCRPVARMPMGQAFPMIHPVQEKRTDQIRFLLIGDPIGDLPEARREIDLLEKSLRGGLDHGDNGSEEAAALDLWQKSIRITKLVGPEASGRRLNELLSSGDYDVVHYSGHAFFDDEDSDLSGLLLAGGEVFFAQKIRRLLSGQPLVFLNACQSGVTANEPGDEEADETSERKRRAGIFNLKKPAEGLASSFIYGGARGCIGALWPIYDEPAARFAMEFYRNILDGYMIGEAMRLTRQTIKRNPDYGITWAAYVLYGDPTFRLVE